MTDAEMGEYLSQFSELRCENKRLSFDHSEANRIVVDLRVSEPHQLLFRARLVAALIFEEKHFRSAYLWITLWGVWNPNVEAIAFNTLERHRQGFGENRSLTTAPGHLFRQDEFVSSVACLIQPMLVGWDTYYIPQADYGHLEHFVFVSHDSFIDIQTRTIAAHEKAMNILQQYSWLKVDHGQG
ncbi:MAG TPA: hypothetical protein VK466_04785 [Terriglobales bacterium]|nr:hypothetical protein [Terriglobales bacterium]